MKALVTFAMRYYFLTAELPFVLTDCDGIYNFPPCCVGEKLDQSKQICKKCPRGLYGGNCTHTCEVPYFGYRCVLGRCACTRDSCNIPPSICSPNSETEVSGSTLPATVITTTNKQDMSTPVTTFSTEPDTRGEDPGFWTSAAGSHFVYIIPITFTLTVFVLIIFSVIFCSKCPYSCNIQNKTRQVNRDYELAIRVYVNNESTNSYDIPNTNTNMHPTVGASESSYESVELYRKDL